LKVRKQFPRGELGLPAGSFCAGVFGLGRLALLDRLLDDVETIVIESRR
jgi:hypothetical protein